MADMPRDVDHFLMRGCGRCAKVDTPECKVHRWASILSDMRSLMQRTGLTEQIRWGFPCYASEAGNLIMITPFVDNCVLSFLHGSLLDDPMGYLEKAGENSQNGRFLRARSWAEWTEKREAAIGFIDQAIALAAQGIKPEKGPTPLPDMPIELSDAFDVDPAFSQAFYNLTPGRQRGYLLHFSQAKQSSTRASRIEKMRDRILDGLGMHD